GPWSGRASAGATLSIRKELQVFTDDFQLAALLAGLLVVPGIHLEAALDVSAAAFGQILLGKLRLTSPEGDVDEGGFLLALVLLVGPDAVDRKPEIRDGGSLWRVPEFRIPREIPDEHDFVEIGHDVGGWKIGGGRAS